MAKVKSTLKEVITREQTVHIHKYVHGKYVDRSLQREYNDNE